MPFRGNCFTEEKKSKSFQTTILLNDVESCLILRGILYVHLQRTAINTTSLVSDSREKWYLGLILVNIKLAGISLSNMVLFS